jgi:lysophospholipase L1-like esterase
MNISSNRYILAVFISTLCVFLWYFFLREPDVIDYPKRGTTIIAFGDSLVEGAGTTAGNDFVSILSRRLNVPIINAGKNGDTAGSALARLESRVLSQDPRVVIILLGGNDAIRRISVSETFQNIATIIDRIHAQGAGVLLIGVRGGLLSDKYKKEFVRLANEKKVSFVPDILEDIFAHADLMYDSLHPNDRGNKLMADRVEPVLLRMLKK